jgi:hypothetical protein
MKRIAIPHQVALALLGASVSFAECGVLWRNNAEVMVGLVLLAISFGSSAFGLARQRLHRHAHR